MRRVATRLAILIAVPVALVALPVVTLPSPEPHPVPPRLYHVPVSLGAADGQGLGAAYGVTHSVTHGTAHSASADAALTQTVNFQPAVQRAGAPTAPVSQPVITTPELDTEHFRAVALSWQHDPAVTSLHAQVRVRSDGGWTGWQDIEASDDVPGGMPHPTAEFLQTTRDGTDLLWVDHADGVQARVLSYSGAAPRDVRVDLIDPGSSAADKTAGGASVVRSAYADVPQPQIYTRAQWGADESLRLRLCPSGPVYSSTLKAGVVHHTVTGNGYSPGDVPAIIRSIYAYHVQGEGWCDVGYNFLVDAFGRIWEGRYGGIDKNVLGAQAGGFNTDTFGVSMIGTFSTQQPPAATVDAVAALAAWKLAHAYGNPVGWTTLTAAPFSGSRYPAGTTHSLPVIMGHRDVDLTSCPGNGGYAMLPQIRAKALADMHNSGLVRPAVATTPRSGNGDGGSVRVTAGMISAGDWQLEVADSKGNVAHKAGGEGSAIDTTWAMTTDDGKPVLPGVYTLTLTSTQAGAAALPWSTTVMVGGPFNRLAGPDRFATAVAVGQAAAPDSADAVIASGRAAPDAVAAGPLAVHLHAPLLLTDTDAVPASVLADIQRRHVTTAYLVGGPAVISPSVAAQLKAAGVGNVVRLGGATRFETAALVAAQVGAAGGAAFVIEGDKGLTDGFTVGGIAGQLGAPILMATAGGVPQPTADALKSLGVTKTTVVGGRIPANVTSTLPGATQIAGADRYATSAAVAKAFAAQMPAGATLLADGDSDFPADALTAAALARPTLLVTSTWVPKSVSGWLSAATNINAITAVGGPVAVGDGVAGTASALAGLR